MNLNTHAVPSDRQKDDNLYQRRSFLFGPAAMTAGLALSEEPGRYDGTEQASALLELCSSSCGGIHSWSWREHHWRNEEKNTAVATKSKLHETRSDFHKIASI